MSKKQYVKLTEYMKSVNYNFPIVHKYKEKSIFVTKNGQNWNRKGARIANEFKLFIISANLNMKDDNKFRFNYKEEDYEIVKNILKYMDKGVGSTTIGIIILGYNNVKKECIRRPFTEKIKDEIKKRDKMCVVCSSKKSLEVDHKDQDYTNCYKVLTVNDGQILCSKCNKIKRGGNSNNRKYALPPCIYSLKKYNKDNFWYDPVKWVNNSVKNLIAKKDKEVNKLSKELEKKNKEIYELTKQLKEVLHKK